MKLTAQERDGVMVLLGEEQRAFLLEEMIRGRRTIFANVLAEQKGSVIPELASYEDVEYLIDSWVYIGYHDAGHVSPQLRCECGRALRYQHIVQNKESGDIKKFGIDHLQMHTNIDTATVADILKGFSRIDLELDEILLKVKGNWTIDREGLPLLEGIVIPANIQRHIDLKLPLLDRQIMRLWRIFNELYGRSQSGVQRREYAPKHTNFNIGTLFEMPVLENAKPPIPSELSPELQEHIMMYLQQRVRSARVLCELLIKKNERLNDRYITGKPRIYYTVCVFLDRLVEEHKCNFVSGDQDDRIYEWV